MLRRERSFETETDERSRLLGSGRGVRYGPLDPDDPAVSPYNLWTVGPTFLFIVGLYIILCVSPRFWHMLTVGSAFGWVV